MSTPNNNPKGIVYILIAMMVFSVQDGIMKHIYNFVSSVMCPNKYMKCPCL